MAKSETEHTVTVQLPSSHYPVIIGRSLLTDRAFIASHVVSRKVLIVTNTTLADLYLPDLLGALAENVCDVVILDDGEEHKNRQSLWKIYDALVANGHHRDTCIIALGGGVIGDIAGFAASTWQRGAPFLQIPTTLLAQIDASVGGKTAINHAGGKNLIGSFYQPSAVLIDMNTLNTLSSRQFRAGLAEIIKYAILVGGHFLQQVHGMLQDWAAADSVAGFLRQSTQMSDIIRQCCQIKADIVQQDERESGVRALLNLGHTVGHALEAVTKYERWLHGEAVAIGLYVAALLSGQQAHLSPEQIEYIDDMLLLAGLPRRIPRDLNRQHIRDLVNADKKIRNNTLRFVLIKAMGDCYIDDSVSDAVLQNVLQTAMEGE